MKLLRTFQITLVLIFLLCGFSYSKVNWKIWTKQTCTNNANIAGFYDRTNGITAGFAGEAHYTMDGGKTWPRGENASMCRFGLEILDAKTAWTCGNGEKNGNIRFTRDGGATWQVKPDFAETEPNHCRYISFIDPMTGWIAAPGRLAVTTDGAGSWTDIKLPGEISNIAAIHLLSKDRGYVFTAAGILYSTENGGETWIPIKIINKGGEFLTKMQKMPAAAIHFNDEKNGILVANVRGKNIRRIVLETKDGGKSWTEDEIPAALRSENLNSQSVFINRDASIITINDWYNKELYVLVNK